MPKQPSGPDNTQTGESTRKQTLKQTGDDLAFMSDIPRKSNSFNTKSIIKALVCKDYQLDPSDPIVPIVANKDTRTRQTKRIIDDYPNLIQKAMDNFQNQIGQLQALNSRQASIEAQNQISSFAPFNADGTERIQQREKLEQNVDQYVSATRQALHQAIESKKAGEPWPTTQAYFDRVKGQTQEMLDNLTKLSRNERSTIQNLNMMVRRVTDILNAERSKLGIPVTPEMQRGPQ